MPPMPDCPDPIVEPGPFHSLGPNDDMFVRQMYDNKQQLIFSLSLKQPEKSFSLRPNILTKIIMRFSSTKPQVAAYLSEIPRAKWTRAYSPSKRYDYMTSNSAEFLSSSVVFHRNGVTSIASIEREKKSQKIRKARYPPCPKHFHASFILLTLLCNFSIKDRRLRFHLHLSTSSSQSRKRASETRSIAKSLGFASFSLITTTLLLLATITADQTPTPTPPSPLPASDSCNGVYLSYTYTSGSKLPPNGTSNQPYRFESTLRVLNNADEELKSWRVFVGFQHDEYLVSASNAVIADGSATFPGPVGNNTVFAGFPSADLKTAIETAGDVNQMSVEVDFVGTQFGVDSPAVPMPSNISLVNDGFVCPRPSMQDVSPLAGMDGLLGVSAYDADKNCTCLFVSSKATPYQSIPTMVGSMISIRIKNRKFYQNQYAFCNQLLTAPATPLFPSLESESHKIFMNQNGDSKDHHPNAPKFRVRTTINEAFRCWCQACWQYSVEYPLSSILNSDVTNNPSEGVFVGLLLSMSLTTVVLKFLMEKNSVNALHRKVCCTYEESVYPLPKSCDWEISAEMMVVKPPIMDTRQAGRPRNRNHIPSQGEEPIVRRYRRCDSTTHNAMTCPTLVPMNQKRLEKNSATSGSNTKGKGKGTQGTQETLETHGT
ncbi:unnamed protein product [Lactuca saligna]|uniref:COBRA-like protein n=1 Tax=Lactuca saligna TaxID=75948 RepID=A0AA35YSM5_LACSI|nr:unnamed protein product [Lactuca saligna]